jgi:DNA-binding NarL/FixJ family response regulator
MSSMERAGQDRGRGLTGEKHPRAGGMSGDQGVQITTQCDVCARLQHINELPARRLPQGATVGLRIALVGDDEQTRLAARQMLQGQRHGWALECYQPCPMRELSGHQGPSPPSALNGHGRPGAPPDVVLISLGSGHGSVLACLRKLNALAPKLPLLIISGDRDDAVVAEHCWAGADGYLLKPVAPGELGRAVNSLAEGCPALCPQAQKALMNIWHRAATAAVVWLRGLSVREQEIVGCLVAGRRDKEIEERLGIRPATLHAHLQHIYRKLAVHGRKQVVAKVLGAWRGRGGA